MSQPLHPIPSRFSALRVLAATLALSAASATLAAGEAFAQAVKIATVDFQRAISEVNEGKAAKARLEKMFDEKRMALQKMEQQLMTAQADYEKQAMVLSDAARKAKEQELMQAQASFQQTYMQSEQDFQMAYGQAMDGLITKMKTLTEVLAKEKGYSLVIEVNEGGVVYTSPAFDLTADLITRYNAGK